MSKFDEDNAEGAAARADAVTTYLSDDGLLRVRVARVSAVVADGMARHGLSRYARYAFARAVGAVALMPFSWKDADRVSVQWAGLGSVGYVIVEARLGGAIRGFVKNPDATTPRAFSMTRRPNTIGFDPRGSVAVTKQASSGQHSQGQVGLTDGSVDGDLAAWFNQSEQIPTALRVDVSDDEVIGVLVQSLPGAEGARASSALPEFSGDNPLLGASDGTILTRLGVAAHVVEKTALRFECTCSRERIAGAMSMLTEQDLLAMLAEDHGASVTCEFCAEAYTFSDVDLTEFIDARNVLKN